MNPRDTTGILWVLFGLYWIIRAFRNHRDVWKQSIAGRLLQFILWTLGFSLVYSHRLDDTFFAHQLISSDPWMIGVGTFLTAVGIGFAVWARLHLGKYWSSTVTLKENHQLIRTGPYGLSRHPIYSGIVLALVGTFLAIGELRSLIAVTVIFFAISLKIKDEEAMLSQHFGVVYQQYAREVKRLIPGVW